MSFTFTVSALSSIRSLDIRALAVSLGKDPGARTLMYTMEQAEPFYRSFSPGEIRAWWRGLQDRYASQLNEDVAWNEEDRSEITRDLYAGQSLSLDTLAAHLDQNGPADLVRRFEALPRDEYGAATATLSEARRRGFAARYPQVSIASTYYLPFRANLVLKEPDWQGETEWFGSLPSLVEELTDILRVVEAEAPETAAAGQVDKGGLSPLAGAYNAGRIKLELARIGIAKRLPFWFSE